MIRMVMSVIEMMTVVMMIMIMMMTKSGGRGMGREIGSC